jgi:hypothetical protein
VRRSLAAAVLMLPAIAAAQDFQLQRVKDRAVIAAAKESILAAGEACAGVSHMWRVVQEQTLETVYKVSCSDGRDFQVTAVGPKMYARAWTGKIFGQ